MAAERQTPFEEELAARRIDAAVPYDRARDEALDDDLYAEEGGIGLGGIIAGVVLIALAAILVVFLLSLRHPQEADVGAVTAAPAPAADVSAKADQDAAAASHEAAVDTGQASH